MSNFIINFSRIIVLAALSMSSQVSIAMERYDFENSSYLGDNSPSFKRQRTDSSYGSEEGETDTSDFGTQEYKATSLSDPRIQALLARSDFTFIPAPEISKKSTTNIADKENLKLVNGSDPKTLRGAWYKKPETGNLVLNLGPVKGYATIIPGSVVELLFGSAEQREEYIYPSVLLAQQATEEMATRRGLPFMKKQITTDKKCLLKKKKN